MRNRWTATVIVIDDDASVGRALRTLLRIAGFDVLVFGSAEEMLVSGIPAGKVCLLIDIYMPGMSGIDLCGHLASLGSSPPIVLMSGRDDQRTRRIMLDTQPVATLFKPFDEKALLRAIRKALGSNRTALP